MTADLLTLDDIAAMHHCSIRHARDVLVKLPGFPAEVIHPHVGAHALLTASPVRRMKMQQEAA